MLDKRVSLYLGNMEKSFRHVHEAIECYLVIKGELEIEIEEESVLLRADDLLVINMNQVHLVKGSKKNLILCLRIEKEYLEQECRELLSRRINCNSTRETEADQKNYYECKRLLTRMLLIYTEKKKGYELEFKAVFYLFLSHLEACFTGEDEEHAVSEPLGLAEPLDEVLQYIRVSYNRDITMEEMAGIAHLSPPYFSRYFKQKVGIGFLDYLTKIRLEHTLQPLLHTDHSILKIAMEHGFANQKSFSEKFKKEYGENPSEYRKKYRNPVDGAQAEAIRDTFDIHMEDGLIPFLKYIHQHDTDDRRGAARTYEYRLDVKNCVPEPVCKVPLMINIEHMYNMQNPEILEQLEDAGRTLHFTYVYFEAFSEAREYAPIRRDSFDFYELYQMMRRIEGFGFLPFIRIDYSSICGQKAWGADAGSFVNYLKAAFRFLVSRFSAAYIRQWKVELCYSDRAHAERFGTFYLAVSGLMRQYVGADGVGVLALRSLSGSDKKEFGQFLDYAAAHQVVPGFYSFHAYPDEDLFHAFQDNYQAMHGYYNTLIAEIKRIAGVAGCAAENIYLTKWNTLAGRNLAESGTFFRASLIVDTFRRIAPLIRGIGLHLNTYEVSREKARTNTAVLALYLFNKVKRPIFFVAEALQRLGYELLMQNEQVHVTRGADGEYAVLLCHPSYVNPGDSIDPAFLREYTTQIAVGLQGLEPGRYQIKTFNMGQEGSGVFNRWESAGFPDFMDPDVVRYLELVVIPELKVEEVMITGSYQVQEAITFNGLILKLLKPV